MRDQSQHEKGSRSYLSQFDVKIHELTKQVKTFVNVFFFYFFQPDGAEFFYAKTCHRASDNNGGFHVLK